MNLPKNISCILLLLLLLYLTTIVSAEREPSEKIEVPAALTVQRCSTESLFPTLTPLLAYHDFSWDVEDDTVILVDACGFGDGVNITGLKAGTSAITFFLPNGESACCMVTVLDAPMPESISIPAEYSIPLYADWDIAVQLYPADAACFFSISSDDDTVVAVEETAGNTLLASGVGVGTATIIVYTDNGLSASCLVTVTGSSEPTAISIPETYTMLEGEGWEIPITLEPEDAIGIYDIVIDEATAEDIVLVTTAGYHICLVYAYLGGEATITVTTQNGLSATTHVTVLHNWQEEPCTVAATCSRDGYSGYPCINCSAVKDQIVIPATHCHPMQNGVCTECGKTFPLGDLDVLILPEELEIVCAEAFLGTTAEAVIVPAACQEIAALAFADCENLQYVLLLGETTLDEQAFGSLTPEILIDR